LKWSAVQTGWKRGNTVRKETVEWCIAQNVERLSMRVIYIGKILVAGSNPGAPEPNVWSAGFAAVQGKTQEMES
jgi:hypothetical protein